MAAAAVPRKSPGSSAGQDTAPASAGFVPIDHDIIDRGPILVGGDHCAHWLLMKALSEVNRRTYRLNGNGRAATGATGLLRVADLQKMATIWERREIQYAVETLTDEEFPLFRLVRGDDAVAEKLCAEKEYTPRQLYEGFFLVPNHAAWGEIHKNRRKEWREENDLKAQKKREKEEAQVASPEAQVVAIARIGRRESGQPLPRAAVPASVRSRIHEIEPPEDLAPGSEFVVSLEGNVLKCQFSLLPDLSASPAVAATAHTGAQYDPIESATSLVEPKSTAHGGAQYQPPPVEPEPGKRRTEGECTAHGGAQYLKNGNGHNGHQANGNGHHPADLSLYPQFTERARLQHPTVQDSFLVTLILACQTAAFEGGQCPSYASDDLLARLLLVKTVTPKFMRQPEMWLNVKGGKGTLVQAVLNAARLQTQYETRERERITASFPVRTIVPDPDLPAMEDEPWN
jgi:hypothetical protein